MNFGKDPQKARVAKEVYDRAIARGMSHTSAVALLANVERESGFNPSIYGDNGNSYGLFQYNGVNKRGYFKYADSLGLDRSSPTAQVDYMIDKYMPETGQKHVAMFNSDNLSAEDKAVYFMQHFERPRDKNIPSFIQGQKQLGTKWMQNLGGENTKTTVDLSSIQQPTKSSTPPSQTKFTPGNQRTTLSVGRGAIPSQEEAEAAEFNHAMPETPPREDLMPPPAPIQQPKVDPALVPDPVFGPSPTQILAKQGIQVGNLLGNSFQVPQENSFALGGETSKLGFGQVLGGIGSGIAGITGAALSNAQISDVSGIQSKIDYTKNISPSSNSYDGLAQEWGSANYIDPSSINVKGASFGKAALGTLGGIGSGAAAGSMFGPVGGIVGGAIGAIGGIAGALFGRSKAKREQNRLRGLAMDANSNLTNTFLAKADALEDTNDRMLMNSFSQGGQLTEIQNGGTHEQNPYGGVPVSIGANGSPNMLEEGETKFNDYVFSDRLFLPKQSLQGLGLNTKKPITFAEASKELQKEAEERPYDNISKRGLEDGMRKLKGLQEQYKQLLGIAPPNVQGNMFAYGGDEDWDNARAHAKLVGTPYFGSTVSVPEFTVTTNRKLPIFPTIPGLPSASSLPIMEPVQVTPYTGSYKVEDEVDTSVNVNGRSRGLTPYLRFAPVLGNAIGVATDLMGLTNTPDNSIADSLQGIVSNTPYTFHRFGEKAVYRPFDREYHANKLASQTAANRHAILNASNGNAGSAIAGLIGNNFTAQQNLGALYRQGEEFNHNQRMQVLQHNNALDAQNAQMDMQAYNINRGAEAQRVNLAVQRAQLLQRARDMASQGRSANLTGLFNSLGDIGREAFVMNQIRTNPALLYSQDSLGNVFYRGR